MNTFSDTNNNDDVFDVADNIMCCVVKKTIAGDRTLAKPILSKVTFMVVVYTSVAGGAGDK